MRLKRGVCKTKKLYRKTVWEMRKYSGRKKKKRRKRDLMSSEKDYFEIVL